MNEKAKKFKETISTIRTSGNFNTSGLTNNESVQRMNERIQANIDKNQEIINKGIERLNNERYKVESER